MREDSLRVIPFRLLREQRRMLASIEASWMTIADQTHALDTDAQQ